MQIIKAQTRAEADYYFDLAIDVHHLSANIKAWNYAGNYMYMSNNIIGEHRVVQFKHHDTREYYNLYITILI